MNGVMERRIFVTGVMARVCARVACVDGRGASGTLRIGNHDRFWAIAPARARGAVVVLLSFACHADVVATPNVASSFELLAFALPVELLIGFGLGFVVYLIVATAEVAADIVGPQMGFGAAQIFDPMTHTSQSALASLLRHAAVLLAVITGLHRVLIGGILASFRALPPGCLVDPAHATPAVIAITSDALSAGVRMAMPIVAVLLMTQVALAFVSRAAPAMQIFSVGFAVTLAVGAVTLILIAPDFSRSVIAQASHAESRFESMIVSFAAVPQ